MTGTASKNSTSLQQAKARLEAAIGRLERAIEKRAEDNQGDSNQLTGALDAARTEIRELRETHQTVSARLDAAIGKMKVLVEE